MVKSKTIINATKWSVIGEIVAKLISPITTIILARILAKEVFGIVASITTIVSLADLLTDAGFNAYIVQHEFGSDEEKEATYNVCFWSNLAISILLFFIIFFNNALFSRLVGASGYGLALIIASLVLPLTSISSIEQAIMKRNLDFKKVGLIKIISKIIPLLTTIPLALLGQGYWSIIIGTLCGEVVSVILCLIFGEYKPRFSYKIEYFGKIFSFSGWAFLESILEWLLANVAILVLANIYGNVYLGVFKTGLALITQITTAIYALYSNVFKSSVSREQNDAEAFKRVFFAFQKYTSILSIPIGVGAFLYRGFLTKLLLGDGWEEAILLIGLWALVSLLSIAFGNFYSDSIRAKGKPKFLVLIDSIYLIALIMLLVFAKNLSFDSFCIWFCLIKITQPLLQVLFGVFICKISFAKVLFNCYPQIIAVLVMVGFNFLIKFSEMSTWYSVLGIVLSAILYFICLIILMPKKKETLANIIDLVKKRKVEEGEREVSDE